MKYVRHAQMQWLSFNEITEIHLQHTVHEWNPDSRKLLISIVQIHQLQNNIIGLLNSTFSLMYTEEETPRDLSRTTVENIMEYSCLHMLLDTLLGSAVSASPIWLILLSVLHLLHDDDFEMK